MSSTITVALAGNPNAGKTTLFNAFTGARQHVGNWPGVTVEKKEGSLKHGDREIHVVDLPGTYSLTAYSLEEIIARTFIVESPPDVVVAVLDASNLERNLYLAVQLLEMGAKVVMALNMIDVAEGRHIHIDHRTLSQLLGIPVIPTNGKKRIGIDELLDEIVKQSDGSGLSTDTTRIRYGTEVEEEVAKVEGKLVTTDVGYRGLAARWLAVKLLEGDPDIGKKLEAAPGNEPAMQQVEESRRHLTGIFADPPEIILTDARYGFISGAVKQSVRVDTVDRIHWSESIDKVLTDRLLGPIILLGVLYVVYVFVFQGSEPLVGVLEALFKWMGSVLEDLLPEGLLRSLVINGIIDGVGGVLRFTPLIAFMFMAIAFLEDTGYMARIAFMLDRVLKGFGLHGASMLALMVSGGLAGGCAVPGIMATRTMKEPKERLVTILVAPLMNCGAKLPVYALLIGAFFSGRQAPMMFLLTIISWTMALLAGKVIRSTVLAGPSAPFVLELPPYRVPTLRGLLIHTWERTWMYLKKAGTVILAISILLWAMMTFPQLPEERVRFYDLQKAQLVQDLLKQPGVSSIFSSEADLEAFEKYREAPATPVGRKIEKNHPQFASLSARVGRIEKMKSSAVRDDESSVAAGVAQAYAAYSAKKPAVMGALQRERLGNTIAGRVGMKLEWVFKPIGFDWKTIVALVGGFAAKEVVVSTLGTAYSLGSVNPEEAGSLSDQLKNEPGWNPLKAFTLILFVMLYAPCFVTLVVIRRETGKWRWPLFAMAYTTTLAYCVALLVNTVGTLLGLGVS